MALAHALEYPGKLRLPKDAYLATQTIYYPGFTFGGVCEVGGIFALVALLFHTPLATSRFWLVAAALALMLGVQVIFWLVTQPVNKFWVKDLDLHAAGGRFFSLGGTKEVRDWKELHDIWEYSHVARAVLVMLSLIAVTVALASNP
jgi:hypothetical protein